MVEQIPGTLWSEKFLQKQFVERLINYWITPALAFLDSMPRIETDAESIVAMKESYGVSNDPKLAQPTGVMPGVQFKDIEISGIEKTEATIAAKGFQIKIRDRARIYQTGVDNIFRSLQAVTWWALKAMSDEMAFTLREEVRQSASGQAFYDYVNAGSHKTWGEVGALPLMDLLKIKETIKFEDMPYRATDVFLDSSNFTELLELLTMSEFSTDQQRASFWEEQDSTLPTITIPIYRLKIHELMSGIEAGHLLALDANNAPVTMYYTQNPLYPQDVKKDYGLHVFTKDDRENGWYLIRVWYETAFAPRLPYAGLYGDGI